jgi:hypothetical protein
MNISLDVAAMVAAARHFVGVYFLQTMCAACMFQYHVHSILLTWCVVLVAYSGDVSTSSISVVVDTYSWNADVPGTHDFSSFSHITRGKGKRARVEADKTLARSNKRAGGIASGTGSVMDHAPELTDGTSSTAVDVSVCEVYNECISVWWKSTRFCQFFSFYCARMRSKFQYVSFT